MSGFVQLASIFALLVGGNLYIRIAFVGVFAGFMLRYFLPDYRETLSSNPERKDREQLLQYLTEVITDDQSAQSHYAVGTELDADAAQPLSEEEIATLLQQKVIRA